MQLKKKKKNIHIINLNLRLVVSWISWWSYILLMSSYLFLQFSKVCENVNNLLTLR